MDCDDCKYEELSCDEVPCRNCWSIEYWKPKDNFLVFRSLNDCAEIHREVDVEINKSISYNKRQDTELARLAGVQKDIKKELDTKKSKEGHNLEWHGLNIRLNIHNNTFAAIDERISKLENQTRLNLEIADNNKKELSKLEKHIEGHGKDIEKTDKELSELKKSMTFWQEALDIKISELKEQVDLYNEKCWIPQGNDIAELKERVEGIFKSIHGVSPDEVDNVKKEITELKTWIKELEKEYNNHTHHGVIADNHKRIKKLETDYKELRFQFDGHQKTNNEVLLRQDKELSELKTDFSALRLTCESEIEELKEELDHLDGHYAGKITELKEQIEKYKGMINDIRHYERENRKVLRELGEEVKELIWLAEKEDWTSMQLTPLRMKTIKTIEKLDSDECHHESDLIVCRKCAHPDIIAMMDKYGADAISKTKEDSESKPRKVKNADVYRTQEKIVKDSESKEEIFEYNSYARDKDSGETSVMSHRDDSKVQDEANVTDSKPELIDENIGLDHIPDWYRKDHPECDFEDKTHRCNHRNQPLKYCLGYDDCRFYQHLIHDTLKEEHPEPIVFDTKLAKKNIEKVFGKDLPEPIEDCECKVLVNMVCVDCGKKHLTPSEQTEKPLIFERHRTGISSWGTLEQYKNMPEELPDKEGKYILVEKEYLEKWKELLDEVSWNYDLIEEIEIIREDLWKYLSEDK